MRRDGGSGGFKVQVCPSTFARVSAKPQPISSADSPRRFVPSLSVYLAPYSTRHGRTLSPSWTASEASAVRDGQKGL